MGAQPVADSVDAPFHDREGLALGPDVIFMKDRLGLGVDEHELGRGGADVEAEEHVPDLAFLKLVRRPSLLEPPRVAQQQLGQGAGDRAVGDEVLELGEPLDEGPAVEHASLGQIPGREQGRPLRDAYLRELGHDEPGGIYALLLQELLEGLHQDAVLGGSALEDDDAVAGHPLDFAHQI